MKSVTNKYLAAAMLSLGAEYVYADRSDQKHVKFHFLGTEDAKDLEAIERDWTNEVLMVNAVKMKNSLQKVNSIIYSQEEL